MGECGVLSDSVLPVHRPLLCELRCSALSRHATVLQRPRRIALDFVDPDSCAEHTISDRVCSHLLAASANAWQHACSSRDTESLWRLWCQDAESYLLKRAHLARKSTGDDCKCRGRGQIRTKSQLITAKQGTNCEATSMKLNKLGKLQRRLVDLQRQCLNDVPARTTECQHLWNKCRRIGRTILSEGAWFDKWQVACVPSGEQMQLIVQELRCEISAWARPRHRHTPDRRARP